MSFGLWDTPSGRFRRWGKRGRGYTRAPMFARITVVLLAAALVGTIAWQFTQRLLHPAPTATVAPAGSAVGGASSAPATAAWESQVMDALQDATAQGLAGNITAAEVGVDRSAAIVTAARLQGQAAAPDFFEFGIRGLDQVLRTHPENQRLLEHVTQAKIELAQLRCAQTGATTAGTAIRQAAFRGDQSMGRSRRPRRSGRQGAARDRRPGTCGVGVSAGSRSAECAGRGDGEWELC